jgi:hypothetical protein
LKGFFFLSRTYLEISPYNKSLGLFAKWLFKILFVVKGGFSECGCGAVGFLIELFFPVMVFCLINLLFDPDLLYFLSVFRCFEDCPKRWQGLLDQPQIFFALLYKFAIVIDPLADSFSIVSSLKMSHNIILVLCCELLIEVVIVSIIRLVAFLIVLD